MINIRANMALLGHRAVVVERMCHKQSDKIFHNLFTTHMSYKQ